MREVLLVAYAHAHHVNSGSSECTNERLTHVTEFRHFQPSFSGLRCFPAASAPQLKLLSLRVASFWDKQSGSMTHKHF